MEFYFFPEKKNLIIFCRLYKYHSLWVILNLIFNHKSLRVIHYQVSNFNQILREDLQQLWLGYSKNVKEILKSIETQKYKEVTYHKVQELDHLVIQISLKAKEIYPGQVLFYELPLSTTSSRTFTSKSQKWSEEYKHDHWVIASADSIWIAWRQEATYFVVVMKHIKKKNLFIETLKRGDKMFQVSIQSQQDLIYQYVTPEQKIANKSDVKPELKKLWFNYSELVHVILQKIREKMYQEVTYLKVQALDSLVLQISSLAKEIYPDQILFYELPLSITSSKTSTAKSVKWCKGHTNDHWVIASADSIWIAWRQEAAYFVVVMKHIESKNLFIDTLKRGDELFQVSFSKGTETLSKENLEIKQNPINEDKQFVSEIQNNNIPDGLLIQYCSVKDLWIQYKNLVEKVQNFVSEKQNQDISDIMLDQLDSYVNQISTYFIQYQPQNSTLFYGLPLIVTANKVQTEQSKLWRQKYQRDHQIICSANQFSLSWRDEAQNFFLIVQNNLISDDFKKTVQKGEKIFVKVLGQLSEREE